jgi:propanol-preferring alcohol dehydrogenase
MKAMVLNQICDLKKNHFPLKLTSIPAPIPGDNEIRITIHACGVCHTELDEIEGRTPPPNLPVVPGHQIVGIVDERGSQSKKIKSGDRVGVGWIFSACGACDFCSNGNENLCSQFKATGRDANGGYSEYMTIPEDFAYPIPDLFSDIEAAPLLCAGAIGYRSLKLSGLENNQTLGLTGFGGSAHIVLKMVQYRFPDSKVFVFARNKDERFFSKELGAVWAGDITDKPPEKIDCIIDTTHVWKPIIQGLLNLKPGGRLVINAIRKEDVDKNELLNITYPDHLWMEKEIKSVANVCRSDISEFLELAAAIPLKPETQEYKLEDANTALIELKNRKIRGAKVLVCNS